MRQPSCNGTGGNGLPVEVKTYFYDEWDFRAADYKPRWCAVRERLIDEGTDDFYEKTMRERSSALRPQRV